MSACLLYTSKGLERVVNALRVIAPELPFELKFIEINGPEQVFEINGYRITAFKVNHNVLCYGYSLEILRQGKFSPEHCAVSGRLAGHYAVLPADAALRQHRMMLGKGIPNVPCTRKTK